MSEGRAAFDVAKPVNATSSGFKTVIHFYETSIVSFNAGHFQVQAIRIRHSACCHQQVRSGNTFGLPLLLDFKSNASVRLADSLGIRVQKDLDTVLSQDFFEFLCDVRVLAGQQLVASMNYRDVAAEAAEKLPKLHADIATAQHKEVLSRNGTLSRPSSLPQEVSLPAYTSGVSAGGGGAI
jgi:hypothetical protein